MKALLIPLSAVGCIALNSCSEYTTPNTYVAPPMPGESKGNVSELSSNRHLKPTVDFPCRVATARVESHSYSGKMQLFDGRDLERSEYAQILSQLPGVAGMVNLNGSLLEGNQASFKELRNGARRVGADMLAVYRFNTSHQTKHGSTLLSVATLGAAPINSHRTVSSVSLVLMDARTGYIYGVLEEQSDRKRLSSSWGEYNAQENSELESRQQALDKLVSKIPGFWSSVYSRHR